MLLEEKHEVRSSCCDRTAVCMTGQLYVRQDSCMIGQLYDRTAVWQDSCMIGQLYDSTAVWQYSCMTGQLYDSTAVWQDSCRTVQLYDRTAVCQDSCKDVAAILKQTGNIESMFLILYNLKFPAKLGVLTKVCVTLIVEVWPEGVFYKPVSQIFVWRNLKFFFYSEDFVCLATYVTDMQFGVTKF